VAEPFASHPLVIVAAPSHRLATRRDIPIQELALENFLIREQGSGTRAAMEQVFKARRASYQASMEVSSNETIKQAVIAGMGVSFISLHTVGLELEAGRLVVLDVVGLPIMRQWFVIHLKAKRLSPIATAFRGLLLESGAGLIAAAVERPGPA
jgi:DNA-binding transcriptional LysR family regulator